MRFQVLSSEINTSIVSVNVRIRSSRIIRYGSSLTYPIVVLSLLCWANITTPGLVECRS